MTATTVINFGPQSSQLIRFLSHTPTYAEVLVTWFSFNPRVSRLSESVKPISFISLENLQSSKLQSWWVWYMLLNNNLLNRNNMYFSMWNCTCWQNWNRMGHTFSKSNKDKWPKQCWIMSRKSELVFGMTSNHIVVSYFIVSTNLAVRECLIYWVPYYRPHMY